MSTSADTLRSLFPNKYDSEPLNNLHKLLISRHPNTPEDVLVTLASDPDEDIRYFVSKNPNVTDEINQLVKENTIEYAMTLIK